MASARLRATNRQHMLSVVAASGDDLDAGLLLRFRLAARLRGGAAARSSAGRGPAASTTRCDHPETPARHGACVAASLLTWRNRATREPWVVTSSVGKLSVRTSSSNAISVPGSTHTATFGSPHRSEAAADRIVEPRRHKLVTNLCRSRCDVHQTVVAHGVSPLLRPKTRPPGFSTKLTEWQFQAIHPIKPSENRRRPVIFAPSYFAPALKAGRLRSAAPADPYHAPDSGSRVSDFLTHHAVMLDFAMQPLIAVQKSEKAQSLRRYFVAPCRIQRIS